MAKAMQKYFHENFNGAETANIQISESFPVYGTYNLITFFCYEILIKNLFILRYSTCLAYSCIQREFVGTIAQQISKRVSRVKECLATSECMVTGTKLQILENQHQFTKVPSFSPPNFHDVATVDSQLLANTGSTEDDSRPTVNDRNSKENLSWFHSF